MAATISYQEVLKQYFHSCWQRKEQSQEERGAVSEGLWCHQLCSGGVASRRARCLSFLRGCGGTIGSGHYYFLKILRVVDRLLNFQSSGSIIFDFILCSLFVITLSFFLYRSACLKVFSLLDLVQYASEKKSQEVTF